MKLDNRTDYPTAELRKMLIAVHNHEAAKRGRLRTWTPLTVRITYARKGDRDYTGHAYFHGCYSHLSIPREGLTREVFVALWRHELWHLYGIEHADYPPSIMWCHPWPELGLVGPLAPVVKAPKPKPQLADVQEAKVVRLLARQKTWEAKVKRATNALKKINKSLTYYEKAAAKRKGTS